MSQNKPLTTTALLRQFLPLSLSDLIMVAAGPIIIAGLARLPGQEVHLAAYGVAEAVAILIESPIIMLLHASTALSRDRAAFLSLKRFMLLANLALTLFYALVAFTPLYDAVFAGWLGQPPAVVEAARPAFQVMLLWPAAIGWRRFYQGVLILRKESTKVGLASVFRILSLALTVVVGVMLHWPGAFVAGLALAVSVVVEAVMVTLYAEMAGVTASALWDQAPDGGSAGGASLPQTLGAVTRWYAPLALTAILIWMSKPAINGGIARTPGAALSLAAWPAIWTTVMLVANAIRMVQQVVITQANSAENYRLLLRFTWWAGALTSGLLALLAYSPAGGVLLTQVTGLSGELAAVAVPALRISVLFPLGVAWQNHLQGVLIRVGRTRAINLAALTGSAVLFLTMLIGVSGGGRGTIVGAVSTVTAQAAEVAVLLWVTRAERQDLLG